MILSQKNIEEIAAAVTKDFNVFYFGCDSEESPSTSQKKWA